MSRKSGHRFSEKDTRGSKYPGTTISNQGGAAEWDAPTRVGTGWPAKWQATKRPGDNSRHSGSRVAHSGRAIGQRVWKRQPGGGASGLGISPFRMMRLLVPASGTFGSGSADSNACV